MANLGNPKNTIEILQKYKFVFQKKYGQNFLIDTHVIDKINRAADIGEEDFVLEIGPGIGTLTQCLCENAREVLAVEIDKALIPILQETLYEYDNITIVNEDFLKMDLNQLVRERNDNLPIKIVANLPYNITSPIIMSIFENKVAVKDLTVMVQKEVAERIQASPGTKDYGSLSLAVQYYARPYIVANVPPNCFIPRPNVASAVIKLTVHEQPPVDVKDERLMFRIIRASFNQRRKTLVNGLYNSKDLRFTKEEIRDALKSQGISEMIRGEALALEQFAGLTNHLASYVT